jgi:hypothetical protein
MPSNSRHLKFITTRAKRAKINAAVIRSNAERCADPEMRAHLISVAADYERIANRAEQLSGLRHQETE